MELPRNDAAASSDTYADVVHTIFFPRPAPLPVSPTRRQEARRFGGSGLLVLCAWVARRYASAMRGRYVAAAMGIAIAIPFMAPVPAYAGTTVFSDNFATKNTSLWNWGAGASVSNGQLVLACDRNYDGQIVTPIAYDLTDSAFTAQLITPPAVGGGHTETGFIASIHPGDIETNSIYMQWVGGELSATWVTGGGGGTFIYYYQGFDYFPGMWLRLRHSSATGLVYWEKSSDATTWTTFASAVPQFDITNVWLSFECGNWEQETSGPAIYGNVSLVHNAPVSPPPPPPPP
jgi:hypothetical protein